MTEKVLTIEKVVFGGKGLSRDLGKVTLVPFTLPGEKVRARVVKEHRDYYEAECIEVLEPSTSRVAPACIYFGKCGGCQLSHASYSSQVEMKKRALEETLTRARVTYPEIQVITAEPFGYRHRAQVKMDTSKKRVGFYASESHDVIDIHECLCLTPGLNRILQTFRKGARSFGSSGPLQFDLYENDRGQTAVYSAEKLPANVKKELEKHAAVYEDKIADDSLTVRFRDYEMPMRPDIFLQVNPLLWKTMIHEVESHHPNSRNLQAVELYCGAGFFTKPLSRLFRQIVACEENPTAINYARTHSHEENIEWVCDNAEHLQWPENTAALIVDPPRRGLRRRISETILVQTPRRITYVSCDASSFARDVALIGHKYGIRRLILIDLFPQTFHFETIALLQSLDCTVP